MPLKNINPTQLKSWENLKIHFEQIKYIHLKDLFEQKPP